MTEAEIIKTFGCCIGDADGKDCFSCPLHAIDDCQNELNLSALDLINRQKVEITALQMDNSQLKSDAITANLNYEHIKEKWCESLEVIYRQTYRFLNTYKELQAAKAEIERLKKENNQFADIGKMYSEIKVETVKKFKNTIRVLFRLEFLRRKRYDKIFDEAEAIMLKGIAGDTE